MPVIVTPPSRCEVCGRQLVPGERESAQNFRDRRSCGPECANVLRARAEARRQADIRDFARDRREWPAPQPDTETGRLWIEELMPAIDAAWEADTRLVAAIGRYTAALDRREMANQRLVAAIARYTAALDREAAAAGLPPHEGDGAP